MTKNDRRPFLGLTWFQVIAGALAAMTSAWIASALGVAGTIIGAAVGSLVVTVSSAFYSTTLDRSRTLIVRTDNGTFVETAAEPGETAAALEEVREATRSPIRGAEVVETARARVHWRTVVVTTVVVLALAVGAMGTYELLTGKSYGAHTDNARIGNPFGGTSSPKPGSDSSPTPDPVDSTTPTSTPSPTVTPTPTESTSPTPTPTEIVPTDGAEPPPAS